MKRIKILACAMMLSMAGAIYAAGYVQDGSQAKMSCCGVAACCTDGAECCKAKADGSHADCCKADAESCAARMAEGDCCKAHQGDKHAAGEAACDMSKKDGKTGCCDGGSCCKAKDTKEGKGV